MEVDNQEDTQLWLDLSNPRMIIVKLESKESLRQSRREQHIVNGRTPELAYDQCACVFSVGNMADPMNGHQGRERSMSAKEQFQKKRHKYFDLHCPLSTWQRFHDEQKPQR